MADRFARFARDEAPGRSAPYAAWALAVADDDELCAALAALSEPHRQPPLVFGVCRLWGAPGSDPAAATAWMHTHLDDVVAECARRAVQTNEPLRCAALLPALSLIDGPIALLEVGASAGLCLYPDRYSYRYRASLGRDGDGIDLDPAGGPSSVVLRTELVGDARGPLTMPEVVWRAGIDLNPLDPAAPDTTRWLDALTWPGEDERATRIRHALAIAAEDPPRLERGDAIARLPEVAAQAPADATLVVTTPGVLPHVPRARRPALIAAARRAGRWITIDAPGTHDGWTGSVSARPGGFVVALEGRQVGTADPLGRWWEWRSGFSATAR